MTLDVYGGLDYMRKLSLGECLTYLREHSGGGGEADTHVYKELGSRQGKVGVKGPVRRLLLEFWNSGRWHHGDNGVDGRRCRQAVSRGLSSQLDSLPNLLQEEFLSAPFSPQHPAQSLSPPGPLSHRLHHAHPPLLLPTL